MKRKFSLLPGCKQVCFPLAAEPVPTETALFPLFPRRGRSQTSRADRSKAIFN